MHKLTYIKKATLEKQIIPESEIDKEKDDKLQRFTREAEAVLAETGIIQEKDLKNKIESLIKSSNAWVDPDIFSYNNADIYEAEIAVQKADFGIVETGTVIITSSLFRNQLPSLLPDRHVAVLRESDLLWNMEEFFEKFKATGIPNRMSFITGPSKTADIELNLVQGVHGPGNLIIIIIRNE